MQLKYYTILTQAHPDVTGLILMFVRVVGSRQQGADPGFSYGGGGGGGAKIMCPHAHYERGTELTFGRGPGTA